MGTGFNLSDPDLIETFPALHINIKCGKQSQINGKFKIIQVGDKPADLLIPARASRVICFTALTGASAWEGVNSCTDRIKIICSSGAENSLGSAFSAKRRKSFLRA